jgi:hypothetical protein
MATKSLAAYSQRTDVDTTVNNVFYPSQQQQYAAAPQQYVQVAQAPPAVVQPGLQVISQTPQVIQPGTVTLSTPVQQANYTQAAYGAGYNGYSGFRGGCGGWVVDGLLWLILLTVFFWLIIFSINPTWLANTNGTANTAWILGAAFLLALIIIIIVGILWMAFSYCGRQ